MSKKLIFILLGLGIIALGVYYLFYSEEWCEDFGYAKNGTYEGYYDNGALKFEKEIKNCYCNGKSNYYFANGGLKLEGWCKGGRNIDIAKSYNEWGSLRSITKYGEPSIITSYEYFNDPHLGNEYSFHLDIEQHQISYMSSETGFLEQKIPTHLFSKLGQYIEHYESHSLIFIKTRYDLVCFDIKTLNIQYSIRDTIHKYSKDFTGCADSTKFDYWIGEFEQDSIKVVFDNLCTKGRVNGFISSPDNLMRNISPTIPRVVDWYY